MSKRLTDGVSRVSVALRCVLHRIKVVECVRRRDTNRSDVFIVGAFRRASCRRRRALDLIPSSVTTRARPLARSCDKTSLLPALRIIYRHCLRRPKAVMCNNDFRTGRGGGGEKISRAARRYCTVMTIYGRSPRHQKERVLVNSEREIRRSAHNARDETQRVVVATRDISDTNDN